MRIGQLAAATGTSPSAIRYYERSGLIARPARQSGQRDYGFESVAELTMIRRGREAGLSIAELGNLSRMLRGRPNAEPVSVRDWAAAKLEDIERRQAELAAIHRQIARWRDCACTNPRLCDAAG